MTDQLKPEDRALIELKSCPFCGGRAEPFCSEHIGEGESWVVFCNDCGAEGPTNEAHREHAEQRWNARTEGHRSGEGLSEDQRRTLDVAMEDLDAAAQPTKSEVFTACGRHAADLRDAIRAALAPPVEAKPADGVREAAARIIWHRFAEFYRENWDDEPHKAEYRAVVDAILALIPARDEAALPEGWVAVPRDITMDMIKAGEDEYADPSPVSGPDGEDADWHSPIQAAWYAMVGAAPQAHPATGTDELPADVVRLVKAAREEKLAGIIMAADNDGVEAIHELFAASNDFASRVPLNEGEGR